MGDEKKYCMICGEREVESGSICPPCKEKVKKEALGDRKKIKIEAEKEKKRHGISGEE